VLYAPSGRPGPFQAIRLGGSGDVTKSHVVWQLIRQGHRDVSSPFLWQGLYYGADRDSRLAPHDIKTGKIVYNEKLSNGKANSMASPVMIRGKLLFLLDDGTGVVVEPGREFKVVARNKVGDGESLDFGASPAIADGRLYLRSQSHLYCIGGKD
jgi:outer membrane protein assembly factor BamB